MKFKEQSQIFSEEDFVAHHIRAQALFSGFPQNIEEQNILELAPFDGWHTEALLKMGAKTITVIEKNDDALQAFKRNFQKEIASGKVIVIEGDIHHKIYDLKPNTFDTIICAGFLYHTPHYFWIIEGLAQLKPKKVLLETFKSKHFRIKANEFALNAPGMRQVDSSSLDYVFVPSKKIFFQSMKKLNFNIQKEISKKDKKKICKENAVTKDAYLNNWIEDQISCWFEFNQ